MHHTERLQKIESYGAAYDKLIAALPQFPRAMWQYRATPDGWTIHEIIVHIADSEANSYARCRRLPIPGFHRKPVGRLAHRRTRIDGDGV
jgi:hypothetical protein